MTSVAPQFGLDKVHGQAGSGKSRSNITNLDDVDDVTHGFCISNYGMRWKWRRRRPRRFTFTADRPRNSVHWYFYCQWFCPCPATMEMQAERMLVETAKRRKAITIMNPTVLRIHQCSLGPTLLAGSASAADIPSRTGSGCTGPGGQNWPGPATVWYAGRSGGPNEAGLFRPGHIEIHGQGDAPRVRLGQRLRPSPSTLPTWSSKALKLTGSGTSHETIDSGVQNDQEGAACHRPEQTGLEGHLYGRRHPWRARRSCSKATPSSAR